MEVSKIIRIVFIGIFGIFIGYYMSLASLSSNKDISIHFDKIVPLEALYYSNHSNIFSMQELLDHMPHAQQFLSHLYQEVQIDNGVRVIYFGNDFDKRVPRRFIPKFLQTEKNILWNGYNNWQIGQPILQKIMLTI